MLTGDKCSGPSVATADGFTHSMVMLLGSFPPTAESLINGAGSAFDCEPEFLVSLMRQRLSHTVCCRWIGSLNTNLKEGLLQQGSENRWW